jgi:hypothetical protein
MKSLALIAAASLAASSSAQVSPPCSLYDPTHKVSWEPRFLFGGRLRTDAQMT